MSARTQPDRRDPDGAKRVEVDVEIMEEQGGFAADEFAADLVVRSGSAFDEKDIASRAREACGQCGAGNSAADDKDLRPPRHRPFTRETQRRNGNTCRTFAAAAGSPAAARVRRQSAALKARAIETGPSCCTN